MVILDELIIPQHSPKKFTAGSLAQASRAPPILVKFEEVESKLIPQSSNKAFEQARYTKDTEKLNPLYFQSIIIFAK